MMTQKSDCLQDAKKKLIIHLVNFLERISQKVALFFFAEILCLYETLICFITNT